MESGFDAVRQGNLEVLRSALNDERALQAVNQDEQTLFIYAALLGNTEAAKMLVEAGADVNAIDIGGRSALLWAAAEGHASLLSYILELAPSHLSTVTKSGNSPLHRAAAYGQVAVMRRLIDAGADIASLNDDGASPLSRAARWGHADAVALLLEAGADPLTPDANGKNPLDWALSKGFQDVAALLKPAHHQQQQGAHHPAPGGAARGAASSSSAAAVQDDEGDHDLAAEGVTGLNEGENEAGGEGEAWDDGEGAGEYDEFGGGPTPMRVEGWMAKQGHIFRNWKNRWFVLDGRHMYYFSKETATKARGVIHMVDGTDVIIEEKYPKPFCFTIITPSKRFVLQAADEDEMAEWLEAIQNNLECSYEAEENEGAGGEMGDDD